MLSKAKAAIKSFRAKRLSLSQGDKSVSLNLKSVDETSSSIQQRTAKNEEDVTIVWLTKDSKNTIDLSLIDTLRSINDYIQVRFK
jgi:hypothetical protein